MPELEQELIVSVRQLEEKFGRRWWEDPDHNDDYSNIQRLLWLKEDDEKNGRDGKKHHREPHYLYELTNLRTGEINYYYSFDHILRDYTVTGKPLHKFVAGRKQLRASEGPDFFWKHGHLLRKVPPKKGIAKEQHLLT